MSGPAYTVIVTGATGILGGAIVNELGSKPEQWSKIYALSRSKKGSLPSNAEQIHIDLTSSAKEMSKSLQDIKPDFIFFAAYLQGDSEDENAKLNGSMLENFLDALKETGACRSVKRIILVTGAKQYGVHLGRVKVPMEESDPELRDAEWPVNFYYVQQDILRRKAEEQGSWDWTVTYPNDVIGVAHGNFMNLCTSLGLYALINARLNKTVPYPGSQVWYTQFDSYTDARLHAQFCTWAALEPRASNEAFNVVNGDVQSWQCMWPKLAERFGATVPAKQFIMEYPTAVSNPLAQRSPLASQAERLGLLGSDAAERSFVKGNIDLVAWSQQSDVKEAWADLAKEHGLDHESFEKATWGFLQFVLGREFDCVISMSKARKAGWQGYIDTWEAFETVFEELRAEKVLP